jgi:GNAT superfamily N-acetyltransferase
MTPRLRAVTRTDLPELLGMVRAYYAEEGHPFDETLQPGAVQVLVEGDPLARGWLIEQDGEAIGYVVVTASFSLESGGRDGFIDELYVRPDWRGRGVGGQILAMLDDEARRLRFRRLYLEVTSGNPANRLYRRAGFVDHDRHLMSKRL